MLDSYSVVFSHCIAIRTSSFFVGIRVDVILISSTPFFALIRYSHVFLFSQGVVLMLDMYSVVFRIDSFCAGDSQSCWIPLYVGLNYVRFAFIRFTCLRHSQ